MSKKQTIYLILVIGLILLASYIGYKLFIANKNLVEANNEVARLSKTIQENETTWSRLSQQKDNIISNLENRNDELANIINSREETIYTLTDTIAKIKSVRIIVRRENVHQTEEDSRVRIDFDETVDPVRVSGFALSSPPEAEVNIEYVRPLKLTTVVTQNRRGAWRTYVTSDWPNLEIENIETIVEPYNYPEPEFSIFDRIILGGNINISTDFNAFGNLYALYDFDSFAIGPAFSTGFVNDEPLFTIGVGAQWRPFK